MAADDGGRFRSELLWATVRPCETWAVADRSLFWSRPSEICWVRKKPSTAMTRADRARVVVTTRRCSDRRHRHLSSAVVARCHRRPVRRTRLARRGSLRMTIRARREWRTVAYRPAREGMREERAAPPAPGSLRPLCVSAVLLAAGTFTITHREQHKPFSHSSTRSRRSRPGRRLGSGGAGGQAQAG